MEYSNIQKMVIHWTLYPQGQVGTDAEPHKGLPQGQDCLAARLRVCLQPLPQGDVKQVCHEAPRPEGARHGREGCPLQDRQVCYARVSVVREARAAGWQGP